MMSNFIKKNPKWALLFCIWIAGGALAFAVVVLKTHGPWFARQKNDVDGRYAMKMLNFYMPRDYHDMGEALKQGRPIPDDYARYYRLTAEFLPQDFAGHYLLGLYQQSRGQWEEATASYRRSVEANPYFFWTYYNLGMIYGKNGHPREARRILTAGLQMQPQLTLKALTSTKLLTDILADPYFAGYDPALALQKGYAEAARWTKGEEDPTNFNQTLF